MPKWSACDRLGLERKGSLPTPKKVALIWGRSLGDKSVHTPSIILYSSALVIR